MGRKVYITSDMSIDERLEDVAQHNALAALAWPWFLTAFDDWGRMEANAARLRLELFPAVPEMTRERVEEAIQEYARTGLLCLYEVDGKRYAFIPPAKWFRYQTHIRGSKREVDGSKHPAPDADALERANARNHAQPRAVCTECTPSPSPSPSPSKEQHMCVPSETHVVVDPPPTPKRRRSKYDYTPEFETFWSIYPRPVVKRDAYKQWQARLKECLDSGAPVTAEMLTVAAKHYADECAGKDKEKIKHPATFLSAKHPFADYLRGIPGKRLPPAKEPKQPYTLPTLTDTDLAAGPDGLAAVKASLRGGLK